ncbi:MAG: hypothetical protein U1E66_05230 [Rhodospirillales bacterium]
MTGAKPSLRERIEAEAMANGRSLKDLTVLGGVNDPYRLDTPAMHRTSEWLVGQMQRLRVRLPVHLRGLHYVFVAAADVVRPGGKIYVNDDASWTWLSDTAAKAARWLGYLDWDDIKDERNAAPTFHFAHRPEAPTAGVSFDFDVVLPDDIEPRVWVRPFQARQRYQLFLVGEKSSLEPVLGPIARRHGASLALPTGEPSATMVHAIAVHALEDGRPAVVFYFSDADPSGYQMPVSVARKLQAFRDLQFPTLDVQVQSVALTPDQVALYALPSTPLKETERRADRWKAAFGTEQTEIDALAALRPDLLSELTEDAIAPFYDKTLEARCRQARDDYQELAEAAFDAITDRDAIDDLRLRAEALRADIQARVNDLREEMQAEIGFELLGLPRPRVPEAEASGEPTTTPVFSTAWDWGDATRRLKGRKSYLGDDDR